MLTKVFLVFISQAQNLESKKEGFYLDPTIPLKYFIKIQLGRYTRFLGGRF